MIDDNSCERAVIRQWNEGAWASAEDTVAREVSLVVEHEGKKRRLWSRPQEFTELALGNVLLEWGAPALAPVPFPAPEDVTLEEGCDENGHAFVRVRFARPCKERDPQSVPGPTTAPELLEHMYNFLHAPGLWDGTGCSHRAAFLRLRPKPGEPHIALLVEDIGRHNCLDRLAGHAALSGLVPGEYALLSTARLTASLYTKAVRLGVKFMISRAAITKMALHDAPKAGITLVGFCRPGEKRLTVFSDPAGRVI